MIGQSDIIEDPNSKTAKTTKPMWGERLYQRRARLALPVLVEWASKRTSLEYGELADELDMLHHRPTNKVLASIGTTLNELSAKLKIDIPPIQVLVVNKNTQLPGAGVGWFISEENYGALSRSEKIELVEEWHRKIFDYENWGLVLKELGLPNYSSDEHAKLRMLIPSSDEDQNPGRLFLKWLRKSKAEKSSKNYVQAIEATLSRLAVKEGWVTSSIFEIKTSRGFSRVSLRLRALQEFVELNTRGNSMYSAALNAYEQFLNEIAAQDVEEDVEELLNDDSLDPTTKSTLINTRLGQGKFREKLIAYWKGCSVTGYPHPRLLVASHTKPWKDSSDVERLSMYNGLLLTPNLDKCFDSGLITFENSGKILISNGLEKAEVLGVSSSMRVRFTHRHLTYMQFHRDNVFLEK